MNNNSIRLAVELSLLSLGAHAAGAGPAVAPNAAAALSDAVRIAQEVGLPTNIIIAQAPATPQSVIAPMPNKDEVKEALSALIATSKSQNNFLVRESIAALGISASFDAISFRGQPRVDPDNLGRRSFAVIEYAGEQRIVIGRIVKLDNRLWNYLLSTDGTLISAAVTRKVDDHLIPVQVPLTYAKAGYEELISFWVNYYRDVLKGKDQITAIN